MEVAENNIEIPVEVAENSIELPIVVEPIAVQNNIDLPIEVEPIKAEVIYNLPIPIVHNGVKNENQMWFVNYRKASRPCHD